MPSGDFGELVLVIGDLHIPRRKSDIPKKFHALLVPGKMKHVLCTGNVGSRQQLDFLRGIAPNVHIVRGDEDGDKQLPDRKVVTIGQLRVSLIRGPGCSVGRRDEFGNDPARDGHRHSDQRPHSPPGDPQVGLEVLRQPGIRFRSLLPDHKGCGPKFCANGARAYGGRLFVRVSTRRRSESHQKK
eukprot:237449_1